MSNIVIIGGTHHNTLSIVRALGHENICFDVILVDNHRQNSYVVTSRYINSYHICKTDSDAIKILKQSYIDKQHKRIIIACSDGITSLLDLEFDELRAYFEIFNCGEQGRLTQYMDKQSQVFIAQKCGFAVPLSNEYIIDKRNNTDIIVNFFPCIIKPLKSIHGGKRFNIANNQQDLNAIISTYGTGDKVLIQQYIQKDYEIVIDGVSVNNVIIIPGFIRKIREYKGGTNYSTTHSNSELPSEISKKATQLIRELGYCGLFGIELIVKGDEYYFVEINLRNDATTYSLSIAGVNLPLIYINALLGQNVKPLIGKQVRNIKSIVENRDFWEVLHLRINILRWYIEYKSAECKYFYDKDDIVPAREARKELLLLLWTKLKRRL